MIDILVDDGVTSFADEESIAKAVELSCFTAVNIKNVSLCLRFAANDVVQQLNAQWRNKDKVTDVLSFPMQEADELDAEESLGDIILASDFVKQEAERLNVTVGDHTIHLVVHGTLHLLGFDHIEDDDAMKMQSLENNIMMELGLHKPYPELPDEVNL